MLKRFPCVTQQKLDADCNCSAASIEFFAGSRRQQGWPNLARCNGSSERLGRRGALGVGVGHLERRRLLLLLLLIHRGGFDPSTVLAFLECLPRGF